MNLVKEGQSIEFFCRPPFFFISRIRYNKYISQREGLLRFGILRNYRYCPARCFFYESIKEALCIRLKTACLP